jgi:hypothetical protein
MPGLPDVIGARRTGAANRSKTGPSLLEILKNRNFDKFAQICDSGQRLHRFAPVNEAFFEKSGAVEGSVLGVFAARREAASGVFGTKSQG